MRAALVSFALAAVLVGGSSALAGTYTGGSANQSGRVDKGGMPGEVGADNTVSTVSEKEAGRGILKKEVIGVKYEAGLIAFTDPLGRSTSRGAMGFGIDWNLTNTFYGSPTAIYLGVQSGALFSHMGSATSNFFGSNPSDVATNPGANMLIVPTDLKLGYDILDNLRISAHGGGNVIYRTVANSVDLGSSSIGTGSVWRIFPNAGGDVDIGIGRYGAITLRPDVTFTPGNTLFSGVIGLGVALG